MIKSLLRTMLCASLSILGVMMAHPAESAARSSLQAGPLKSGRKRGGVLQARLIEHNRKKKILNVSVDRRATMIFKVNQKTEVRRGDKTIFLSDLLPGDTLEVAYEVRGKNKTAKSVNVLASYFFQKI